MKKTTKIRQAVPADFKVGTTLITSEGYGFTILRQYHPGIWEARGTDGQGEKCVYECEARFYKVEDQTYSAHDDDADLYGYDNGPTGHGDICYSDADCGL